MSLENETRKLLYRYHINIKKYLGQNFLVDANVLDVILKTADLSASDTVIEIGAGPGIMTKRIAAAAGSVIAVELDKPLFGILSSTLSGLKNVRAVQGDILKTKFSDLADTSLPVKVIANLPYYITTPILMHLLGQKLRHSSVLLVMVQKEVGLRIAAEPGSRDFGILSIAVQYYAKPEFVATVTRDSFLPKPKVNSALLKMTILEKPPVRVGDEQRFFSVIKAAFNHRRKTIANSFLISSFGLNRKKITEWLAGSGVDPSKRAEELSMDDFARLSDTVHQYSDSVV